MILNISNISIGYGQRKVQENISFSLQKGRITALMGPNGVGKSTLLKTIMGLIPPFSGHITLDEQNVLTMRVKERAQHICYMPQSYSPFLPFTVREALLMGRAPYVPLWHWPKKRDQDLVEKVLNELGITHLASKECTALSGGEQRMMLLARAMLQEPDFLLLDEPAAALDSQNEERLLAILHKLSAAGLGILLATHSAEHAKMLGADLLCFRPLDDMQS